MPANMLESVPSPQQQQGVLRKTLSAKQVLASTTSATMTAGVESAASASSKAEECWAGAGSIVSFRHASLRKSLKMSLSDARLDLWGELDPITDDDLIECVLGSLGKAAWRNLDLRRSRLTIRGIRALIHALATTRSNVTELCLGSTGLSGEGIAAIAMGLPYLKLTTLSLFDNQINDADIAILCTALPYCASLRVLNLDNNNITDDGAARLRLTLSRTLVKTLLLNNNNLTDIGADMMIDSFRSTFLAQVGLGGNRIKNNGYLECSMTWTLCLCKSDYYKVCVALCSARMFPRRGARSNMSMLPNELIRKVMEALFDLEHILNFDEVDGVLEEVDTTQALLGDEDDIPGFEEDYLAAMAHKRRRRIESRSCSLSYEEGEEYSLVE